jgi:arylformamidase
MKIFDITLPISATTLVWPGDPPVTIERVQKIEEGSEDNLSRIAMGVHTGTHVDAPWHFIADGKKLEDVPLDVFIGLAQVVEIGDDVSVITAEVIRRAGINPDIPRILFKTHNSTWWRRGERQFHSDYVGVSADGAQHLIDVGMKLVGIDYLSIAPYTQTAEPHRILLKSGVVILESVDLSRVETGEYMLYCLPLKLSGVEGAPVRAVLVR